MLLGGSLLLDDRAFGQLVDLALTLLQLEAVLREPGLCGSD